VEHELLSLAQNPPHRAELLGEFINLFRVLPDTLQPAIGFLNLPLDLQRVLSGIENSPLCVCGRRQEEVADEYAEQQTFTELFHFRFLSHLV
jgi:hypothetical protein